MLAYVYATAIVLAGLIVSLLPTIGVDPFALAPAGRAGSCAVPGRNGAWELALGWHSIHPTIQINAAGNITPQAFGWQPRSTGHHA